MQFIYHALSSRVQYNHEYNLTKLFYFRPKFLTLTLPKIVYLPKLEEIVRHFGKYAYSSRNSYTKLLPVKPQIVGFTLLFMLWQMRYIVLIVSFSFTTASLYAKMC